MEGCFPNKGENTTVRLNLIRVAEDGASARWRTEPGEMSVILVLPARPRRRRRSAAAS